MQHQKLKHNVYRHFQKDCKALELFARSVLLLTFSAEIIVLVLDFMASKITY